MVVDSTISKIQALFKKAASTEFAAEAEALQAKAQELMTKYQIEEAMLADRVKETQLTSRDVMIKGSYNIDKSTLLHVIAKNNYCKVIRYRGYCKVFGYEDDIDLVVAMYTALETHMISEMWVAWKSKPDSLHSIPFKKSFFAGYASKINSRLSAAKKQSIDEANQYNGNDSVSLVLVKKEQKVEDYFDANSGMTRTITRTFSSNSGYGAGQSAGGRANIGQGSVGGQSALSR